MVVRPCSSLRYSSWRMVNKAASVDRVVVHFAMCSKIWKIKETTAVTESKLYRTGEANVNQPSYIIAQSKQKIKKSRVKLGKVREELKRDLNEA
ncbi:hypothetical protein QE152_g14421 [Popillia japonica]|uniref:Uncharacterized protein n=1 Tax=Popillia japonica TaxID=7064 RepID=A0AAW1LAB6_POPJA